MSEGAGGGPIRVVIVDDHLLVRSGLEAVLAIFDDITLVAQAETGTEYHHPILQQQNS